MDNGMTLNEPARKGDWFQTFTGKKFWPLDPRPEDFCVEDIAHALANVCRFGGHCRKFYSVAQHACHVSKLLSILFNGHPEAAFEGLHHDDTEAYIGDMVRPLKYCLPEYQAAEALVERGLAEAFLLPLKMPSYVKAADNSLLMTERRDLVTPSGHLWHPSLESIKPLAYVITPWSPKRAESEFLRRYETLTETLTETRIPAWKL